MAETDDGLRGVNGRLDSVDQRLDSVDKRLDSMSGRLDQHEHTLQQHGRTLEQHGKLLVEIKRAVTPIPALHDFVKRVADEHEPRLTALEKHTGIE
jgi:hypothetical protein